MFENITCKSDATIALVSPPCQQFSLHSMVCLSLWQACPPADAFQGRVLTHLQLLFVLMELCKWKH
jgi:hypothetical protein